MSDHDERFKHFILDYPREALEVVGGEELRDLPPGTRIVPLRDEQMSQLFARGFRKVDVVLEIDKPDGEVLPVIEIIEHHSEPRGFSAHRLARYVLDVSEMFKTDRVAVNVLLVGEGDVPRRLRIGINVRSCLTLDYHVARLAHVNALDHLHSTNIAARILLPNMAHPRDRRVDVCVSAVEGLATLELDPHKRLKYGDFLGAYIDLTATEQVAFNARIAEGPLGDGMLTGMWANAEKAGIEKGIALGKAEGEAKGEAKSLLRFLRARGVAVPAVDEARILGCTDLDTLDRWLDRAGTATSVADLLSDENVPTRH